MLHLSIYCILAALTGFDSHRCERTDIPNKPAHDAPVNIHRIRMFSVNFKRLIQLCRIETERERGTFLRVQQTDKMLMEMKWESWK